MKNAKLLIPVVALIMLTACVSVYTGVVTITSVVDTAMKSWADLSVKGLTNADIDMRVTVAHNHYRAACGVAQTSLIAYRQSNDPAQYNAAIASAKLAANQLVDIIAPLLLQPKGVELKIQLSKATVL